MTRIARILPVASLATLCMLGNAPAFAAENVVQRMVVVTGEGRISAAPDQAQVSAGVTSQAVTAAAALNTNNDAMQRVFATLRAAGIPDAKIQTSNFSVSPQYAPFVPDRPEPQPQRIIGYQVSNQVTVIVDDLRNLGTTLDALVRSGANQLGGISFGFREPKPLEERARIEAVREAAAKARTMAEAAGITLGPVLSIQESGGGYQPPRPMVMMAAQAREVAIAPGESNVSVSVTITYGIQ